MKRAIYEAICACFGMEPGSEEASILIREAYQEPENTPRPPRNADVIYYTVQTDGMKEEAPAAYERVGGKWVVRRFSPWKMVVVCYGKNAVENARKIGAFLWLDGYSFPRKILREAGIYPVPDAMEPMEMYEAEGSLWRKRADLTIALRVEEEMVHPRKVGSVNSTPEIIVHYMAAL